MNGQPPKGESTLPNHESQFSTLSTSTSLSMSTVHERDDKPQHPKDGKSPKDSQHQKSESKLDLCWHPLSVLFLVSLTSALCFA